MAYHICTLNGINQGSSGEFLSLKILLDNNLQHPLLLAMAAKAIESLANPARLHILLPHLGKRLQSTGIPSTILGPRETFPFQHLLPRPPRCSLQPPALTLHRVAPLAVAPRWVGWAGCRGGQGPWLSSYLLMGAQSRSPQWHEGALASAGSPGSQNCEWRRKSP